MHRTFLRAALAGVVIAQTCAAGLFPFSSYLGGSDGDVAYAVTVDGSGNTYVVGETSSTNFPFTNGFDNVMENSEAFITKIGTNGQIIFSTLLGTSGSDRAEAVALDAASNVYVTGFTGSGFSFPVTNGFKPAPNVAGIFGFVAKIGARGTNLIYSSYLGSDDGDEQGHGIAVDAAGYAYVTGFTESTNLYVVKAVQARNAGGRDAFLFKIHPSGTSVVYSTYLGGNGNDEGWAVAVDAVSNVYLAGTTESEDFPITNGVPGMASGNVDGFITKISASGTNLVYSTFYGGSSDDYLLCLALDAATNVYVAGYGQSYDFPLTNAIQPEFAGYVWDGYIAALQPSGTQLLFSTYYGGGETDYAYDLDVDVAGNILVAGFTESTDLPVVHGRPYGGGFLDGFTLKLLKGGQRILYSTYLGGAGNDYVRAVAAQRDGTARVVGETFSTAFPVTNAFQSTYGGNQDAFVTKLANDPVILILSNGVTGVVAGWNTYSGVTYQAQLSTNLAYGAWTNLTAPVTAQVGSCCMTVTQAPSASPQFIRVNATPGP